MGVRFLASGLFWFCYLTLCVNVSHADISLISRNPFGIGSAYADRNSQDIAIEKIPNLEEELEFCGSHSIGGTRKFSLLTKQDNKKHWMELSQSLGDFKLVKYDEETRALLIEFAGKFDILPLRHASRPAVPSKHVVRRPTIGDNSNRNTPQDSSTPGRRRIIPRNEKPPRVLPATPQFPEKLPSPPKRV